MKDIKTFISLEEIRNYFIEKCDEEGETFSEEEFAEFIIICENDFFDWLNSNWKFFNER
ncbi:MAG: hypothetical protein FWH18_09060 [Marinilabiliaceae bacterium]|nr:hypothetical protein [Marinilabiliaceae bacterium]